MIGSYLVIIGILMIISGFFLIFAASFYGGANLDRVDEHSPILSDNNSETSFQGRNNEVRGGGIIMLGPIPIIIGSDAKSTRTLVILAIVLSVLYFLIFM
ncbi:DUF131 domain-containing protein [Methanolobus mangrovi]|uniref:DUF131 domain-containing protein n=1 Tax=Methanolobus mangrovi TaxID=3072977 RepID=A0AA51YJK4_9EURY|nr:DUF131 domain-containing protein [Methanolobus mangrovi]WMW22249.1 DUF131 domain-containing protein [Methanolobus mangrovi]